MIRIIELFGTVLTVAAYIGLVLGLVVAWRSTRRKELALALVGVVLIEASRAMRIFGPSFSVEPGAGSLRLTNDSSVVVFLGNVLLMPIGYFVVAIGTLVFAWSYLRQRAIVR